MTKLDHSVLGILVYYDIFSYPLLEPEICDHLNQQTLPDAVAQSLHYLSATGLIHKVGPYYTLQNNSFLIERRENGNNIAATLLPQAKGISRFLYLFPFVRAVGISGSLSKNYADENSDFDYFIIAKTNRLWIASTLLGLFKKLSYITGKQHCFCMNYYIDESYLEIPEHNIFTATELFTLKAGSGQKTISKFLNANTWVRQFYSNYSSERKASELSPLGSLFKNTLEFLLNNIGGNYLDNWLMRKAVTRWKKKKASGKLVDLNGNPINLYLTDKHFCKHNPRYFQAKIVSAYSERMQHIRAVWTVTEDPDKVHYNV